MILLASSFSTSIRFRFNLTFQFSVCYYKCGDVAKFEELAKALLPVIARDVKEDEEASVVCGCLEALVSWTVWTIILFVSGKFHLMYFSV